mgnify:CR=1 FL=1
MGFAETLIYAADTLESLAYNHIAQTGAVVLAVVFAGSYLAGETGSRLRAGLVRLGVFALIGALGALTMVAVNGVPAPQSAEAPVPRKADRRVEDWISRQQQMAETARERATRSGPSGEARAAETARLRLLERAEARRGIERERAEIRRTPGADRNAEQRRREADLELRLADIDRLEGRLQAAARRYRAAQAMFARLADPRSRHAGSEAELREADVLAERNEVDGARAAYRSAIAGRRELDGVPEPERRSGIASALLRYANFEIDRREAKPARAAIDEASAHFAHLRAQHGAFDAIVARARLAIVLGDGIAARGEIAGLRVLVRDSALASRAAEVDVVEARLLMAEGRAPEAIPLLVRTVASLRNELGARPAVGDGEPRRFSEALLGLAEAEFAAGERAAGRAHAAEAVALRRAMAEPRGLIDALLRLAVSEAGAGDADAAARALGAALEVRETLAEKVPRGKTEIAMRLLCAGALRGRDVCRLVPDADATAAGP